MNKIKCVSGFLKYLFQLLFIAIPILQIIGWIAAPEPLAFFEHIFKFTVIPGNYEILHPLTIHERFAGFGLGMVPTAIELFLLYYLIKLFQSFQRNDIFSISNVTYIRNIGYALFAEQFFYPFYQGLMGVIVTMNNPSGHRYASVTFTQVNLGILLTALMVILISWIMAEGYRLREEQLLTV